MASLPPPNPPQAAARLVAAPPPPSDPSSALRAALDAGPAADAAVLDAAMAELTARRAAAAAAGDAADLRLLRRFLDDARSRKAARLDALRAELAAVDEDLALVARAGGGGGLHVGGEAAAAPPLLLPADDDATNATTTEVPAVAAACADPSAGSGGAAIGQRRLRSGRAAGASPSRSSAAVPAGSGDATGTMTDVTSTALAAVAPGTVLAPGVSAAPSPLATRAAKRRVVAQFADLHEAYLTLRREGGGASPDDAAAVAAAVAATPSADGSGGLAEFSRVLAACVRCSEVRQVATFSPPRGAGGGGGGGGGASILSSLDFDATGARLATAGVARLVAVFDFDAVVEAGREGREPPAPTVELASRAKLSCAAWAPAMAASPHALLATDYDGCATLWDVATGTAVTEYDAHDRRVWSADWSPGGGGGSGPGAAFATASDDGTVKLWTLTDRRTPALTLDVGANVCCVAYAPSGGGNELAVGAADHAVRVYDVRSPASPLATLTGHRKAVSYVRYARGGVVSASTDSTLRLWPASAWAKGSDGGAAANTTTTTAATRVFRGHVDERHFVGLAVQGDLLACGSETGDVCVYHASMARPVARRRAVGGDGDGDDGDEDDAPARSPRAGGAGPTPFVSAVTWRPGSSTLVAASSAGVVSVLECGGGGGVGARAE